MTRIVILLLIFEIIRVKTTNVIKKPNFLESLDLLIDKVENFELPGDDGREIYDEYRDVEEEMKIRVLTSEQVAAINRAIVLEAHEEKVAKVEDVEDDSWPDEYGGESDYVMDDWDADEDINMTHSTMKWVTKAPPPLFTYLNPMKATNERPRIIDDSALSEKDFIKLRRHMMEHLRSYMKNGKCAWPQSRWLRVRQLAPAADIVYSPPFVQLHRCAEDTGCCDNENETCSPVEGQHVSLPFTLHTVSFNETIARMEFYNHTRCGCVSRDLLHSQRVTSRVERAHTPELAWRNNDDPTWRNTDNPVTEFLTRFEVQTTTVKPEADPTPQTPQRCICPTLFFAQMVNNTCKCECNWPKNSRRRVDCLSLARGYEHFGLRDRECISQEVCSPPMCDLGVYDLNRGLCPIRKSRRTKTNKFKFTRADKRNT